MERSIRALICRTVHDDPDRRWVAHIADTLDPGTGRIAQRRDTGTGRREYAPTWEAALAAARAHLAPRYRPDVTYHAGIDQNGRVWHTAPNLDPHRPVLAFDPACFAEQPDTPEDPEEETTDDYPVDGLMRTSPALAAFNAEQRARAERERLGRLVQDVADGDGHTAQVDGVKIAPCDTRGKTAEERHLEQALDAALDRTRDLEQQQAVSLEVAEELAGQLEKVEQERDHLTTTLATTARQRDEADKRNARPLKPTNAMVERGMAHIEEKPWTVRSLLTAALTEDDTPAETAAIRDDLATITDTALPLTDQGRAELLHALGYRKP